MKMIAVLLATLAVAGCVAPLGNGVLRSATAFAPNARLVSITSATPEPEAQKQLRAGAEVALTRLGYRFASTGDFILDTGYSERPLTVSYGSEGGLHSAAAKFPNLKLCVQKVHRLTLVVTDIVTGKPVYQGQAEATDCAGLSGDQAMQLANAAVAKLAPANLAP